MDDERMKKIMETSPFEMRFDPQTIRHLGLRMYSTLAPALAEIISNSYDADATNVIVQLIEKDGIPEEIIVEDDGIGLSHEEINSKFLVIGRNRRDEGDEPSSKHGRLPIGKKGLGKLALFGLAKTITITTVKEGKKNQFVLSWDDLMAATGSYRPKANMINEDTTDKDGTVVAMTDLKRKSPFDFKGLADSLSRTFLFDEGFNLLIKSPTGEAIHVDNKRKYDLIDAEFEWDLEADGFFVPGSEYSGKIRGKLITTEKPITPSSGLRGVTLFSRNKLVNAPEFFSGSTSSHFYQYLTGWISADFIDELDEDVISTNRQSIDWEHPEMAKLRRFLAEIVSRVSNEWRQKRKEKKKLRFHEETGIDTEAWVNTMPDDVKENTVKIIETLGGEDALDEYTPVIKALHDIVPEYPLLHWRHLHEHLKERVRTYYTNQQYGDAASQGVQIYCEIIRNLTSRIEDGCDLINRVFSLNNGVPEIQLNDLITDSEKNIQEGQAHLSRGVIKGFRNPISHAPIDTVVPAIFSEVDCLNILSLLSYLITRMDNATVNKD
jgi:uncharacterized protein (TIGR02391 family)